MLYLMLNIALVLMEENVVIVSKIRGCLAWTGWPLFLIRGVPPGLYRKGLRRDKNSKSIPFSLKRGCRYAFFGKRPQIGALGGKRYAFFQPDQGERLREGNKSIPFWLKRGWRYAFWKKRPQMRALSGKRYAFSRNRGLAAAATPHSKARAPRRGATPHSFFQKALYVYTFV